MFFSLFFTLQGSSILQLLIELLQGRLTFEKLPTISPKKSAILKKGLAYGISLPNPNPEDVNSVVYISFQVKLQHKNDYDVLGNH